MEVQTVVDKERGCGWRKPCGLYLRCDGVGRPCGRMPHKLDVCPCCGGGIKPTRGWTWIDPAALFEGAECRDQTATFSPSPCDLCPLADSRLDSMKRAGLLWIGGKFYATPADWMAEVVEQGVSRRIQSVPKDFELGKTWVFVAHREVMTETCEECKGSKFIATDDPTIERECEPCKGTGQVKVAAIFHAFQPTAIEYVVKGDETDEEIERLEARGITPVCVERDDGSESENAVDEFNEFADKLAESYDPQPK